MIYYILGGSINGEPYNTSSLVECTGYTGKYFLESLLYILVFYCTGIGIQLPVGKYISYSHGYLMVSIECKVSIPVSSRIKHSRQLLLWITGIYIYTGMLVLV